MRDRPPRLRLIWLGLWRLSLGDGSYYGWRWWLHFGPLVILFGHSEDADA